MKSALDTCKSISKIGETLIWLGAIGVVVEVILLVLNKMTVALSFLGLEAVFFIVGIRLKCLAAIKLGELEAARVNIELNKRILKILKTAYTHPESYQERASEESENIADEVDWQPEEHDSELNEEQNQDSSNLSVDSDSSAYDAFLEECEREEQEAQKRAKHKKKTHD